ncbi:unnamed protein product [marine sediment metagenome]|uniref:Uncharacterized protein n=1 Tax=marine sediment metagenome TaxID=412755 RepID=X1TW99_9ZZZZ
MEPDRGSFCKRKLAVFTLFSLAGPAAKPDSHRAPVTGGVGTQIKLVVIMAKNPSTLVTPGKARHFSSHY